jgi:ferredoxin--NADP+ reductase
MKGVFVVGAGPAGMFAARQIALAGYDVFLFNRDIKPGGLAEYGIYPLKDKMKSGLRKQFAKVLEMPNVHYFGNVQVGSAYDVTIGELEAMRPAAIVFSCGAQGTKSLGLPGEGLKGVYSAKEFVYQYNRLPPFASMDFSTGKRIAIIGVGNVAIDIARWLLEDDPEKRTEEVILVARRGPLEVKFDKKEIEYVERHVSREQFAQELERVKERCARCGQDVSPEKVIGGYFRHLGDATAIFGDADGRIAGIEIAENDLVLRNDGSTAAKASGETAQIDVDTLIFAIGDTHDAGIGLPMGKDGYATRPNADAPQYPSFEVWDPAASCVFPGRFVAGWARRASTGLVGIARHDGELGANKAIEFLKDAPDSDTLGEAEISALLEAKGLRTVNKGDLALLARAEEQERRARQSATYTFADNEAMLRAIAEQRDVMGLPST